MDTVERQVTLPAHLDEVWELLTRPDELNAWLGDEVVLDPTAGAPGHLLERDGTQRRLVIDDVEPGRRLAWRWWPADDPDAPTSHVEITLIPTTDGTIVRVVEHIASGSSQPMVMASLGDAWSHRLLHLEALFLVAAAVRG